MHWVEMTGDWIRHRPAAAGAVLCAVLAALLATAGPVLTIAGLAGIAVVAVIVHSPIIGLFLVILSGTSLQTLTSAHVIGAPASLTGLIGPIVVVAWVNHVAVRRVALTYSPQMPALLAYGAVVLLSTAIQPAVDLSLTGLARLTQFYILYFLVANIAAESRTHLLATTLALVASMTLSGFLGLLEHFVPALGITDDDPRLIQGAFGSIIDEMSVDSTPIRRATGGLGDSNWFAYCLSVTLPLTVFMWRSFPSPWARTLTAISAFVQMAGMVISYTRAGFVALLVAGAFLMFKRRLPLLPLLAGALLAGATFLIYQPPGFIDRMFSTTYLKEGSTPLRRELLTAGFALASERPLLGFGYGQFGHEFMNRLIVGKSEIAESLIRKVEEGRDLAENIGAHNLYLEVMVEYGLLGLIPFLAFLWFILADLRDTERQGDPVYADLAVCLRSGEVACFVCGMFGHAKALKIIWIFAGLAAALRRRAVEEAVPRPA
jgi:O-antigen ligase